MNAVAVNGLLTLRQAASILQINEFTLSLLVRCGQVPAANIAAPGDPPDLRFNPRSIADMLHNWPVEDSMKNIAAYLNSLKQHFEKKYPQAIKALRELDKHVSAPRRPRGYNLAKVPNKKLGFVYYVRYIENGRLIHSRWCTHTNDPDLAAQFAVENRERILARYHERTSPRGQSRDLYAVMKNYYAENSPYLAIDAQRGRTIIAATRRTYQHFMADQWAPYLRKQGVKDFEEIDTPFMARFQNHCLAEGKKPQTISHYISTVSRVFDHLLTEGAVRHNPCAGLTAIRVKEGDYISRGCYETGALRGAFNRPWGDGFSYLLCLLIYTTGMRNSEIERLRVQDIVTIGDCRFINIPKSKTQNGVRMVPLHEFVYRELDRFMREKGKTVADYLFSAAGGELAGSVYQKANRALSAFTGYDAERLEKEHITFYSGRHFWKTLMNAHELGDVEEYFMGHKVSKDVAKRYNHRDKAGQELLLQKARGVFKILDQQIFL